MILDRLLATGTVASVTDQGSSFRQIVIDAPGVEWRPGQHIRVLVDDPMSFRSVRSGWRDALRTYSLSGAHPAAAQLTLNVLRHPEPGPGVRWADKVREGEAVRFLPPADSFKVQAASECWFVGDDSASAAFQPMMSVLSPAATVHGVIATGVDDALALDRNAAIARVDGSDAEEAHRSILAALGALSPKPNGAVAFIAGRAQTCRDARKFLIEEHGWSPRQIASKPFWAPGRRGLD